MRISECLHTKILARSSENRSIRIPVVSGVDEIELYTIEDV